MLGNAPFAGAGGADPAQVLRALRDETESHLAEGALTGSLDIAPAAERWAACGDGFELRLRVR